MVQTKVFRSRMYTCNNANLHQIPVPDPQGAYLVAVRDAAERIATEEIKPLVCAGTDYRHGSQCQLRQEMGVPWLRAATLRSVACSYLRRHYLYYCILEVS